SLLAAARGEPVPEDGYKGQYIEDVAQAVLKARPDALSSPDPQAIFRAEGLRLMLEEIETSLADFGVHFDVFFSESDLHRRGELQAALDRLRAEGHVYEADGAVWLR